jgi:hypothetical protein
MNRVAIDVTGSATGWSAGGDKRITAAKARHSIAGAVRPWMKNQREKSRPERVGTFLCGDMRFNVAPSAHHFLVVSTIRRLTAVAI